MAVLGLLHVLCSEIDTDRIHRGASQLKAPTSYMPL
jgi:hypothetical protein